MSARFEIVRTDAPQPWHARFRSTNGRVVFTSENYTRRRGAERAVELMCEYLSPYRRFTVEVRDVDERYAPTPVELEPPFYYREITEYAREGRRTVGTRVPLWHDHAYHYRQCWGDECTEGEPPPGTPVRSRIGTAVTR